MSFSYMPPPPTPEVVLPTGDALPGDVRQGKGFSNGDGTGKTGTLPVQVGGTVTPTASAITKSAGIYDDPIIINGVTVPADKVLTGTTIAGTAGTMVNRGAVAITPGPSAQAIPAGFHNGSGSVAGVAVPAANVLAGTTIAGTAGTMPHLTGNRNATGVAKWPDGGLAVYPEKGYQKGGVGDGEIKVSVAQLKTAEPNLVPGNILRGKSIYGTAGELDPAVKGTATLSSSLSRYDVIPKQTRRFPVITIPAGATMIELDMENNSVTDTSLEIYEVTPSTPCKIYLCLKDSSGREIEVYTLQNYQNSQHYYQHAVINFLTPSLTYVYSVYPNSSTHSIQTNDITTLVTNFNRTQPMSLEVVAINSNDTYTAKYSHYIRCKLSYM